MNSGVTKATTALPTRCTALGSRKRPRKPNSVSFRLLCACAVVGMAGAQDTARAKLDLRGDRFRGLTYEEMTPEQKALTDRALAGRGPIGIFNITLRSPELSEAMRGVGGTRSGSPLSARQSELTI